MEIATIIPINEAVIEETITIRQSKRIALGDAIIAATAVVHNLVLITNNISDFKNIDKLNLVDPFGLYN